MASLVDILHGQATFDLAELLAAGFGVRFKRGICGLPPTHIRLFSLLAPQ